MKILTQLIIALVLGFNCMMSWAQSHMDVKIEVEGFGGSEAYLAYYYWDKQYIEDTVTVENGTFSFKQDTSIQPGIYLVVLPPENNYFELIMGEDQQFSVHTDTANLSGNLMVEGSEENEIFYRDVKFLAEKRQVVNTLQGQLKAVDQESEEAAEVKKQIQRVNIEVQDARSDLIDQYPDLLYAAVLRAMKEPEIPEPALQADGTIDSMFAFKYYKKHFFDNFTLNDKRLLRTPVYYNKINQYIEQLTYKIPDSIAVSIDNIVERTDGCKACFRTVVGNMLNRYAESKVMGMDAVYVHMVETYYMSGDAFWADPEQVDKMEERAVAISPTLIGRKAPNLIMKDTTGTYQSLHDIEADLTILYFWDYDCGHCKKKTPQLAEVFQNYKDQDVALYSVSINGAVDEWKESLRKYNLAGMNVQDHKRETGFDSIYDIRSTPRLFVLDEDKIIRFKHIDVDQLAEILDMMLEKDTNKSR